MLLQFFGFLLRLLTLEVYNYASHNFSKIQSLIAYICIHHFDIICLSETYLNFDILSDNENVDIPGYRLV